MPTQKKEFTKDLKTLVNGVNNQNKKNRILINKLDELISLIKKKKRSFWTVTLTILSWTLSIASVVVPIYLTINIFKYDKANSPLIVQSSDISLSDNDNEDYKIETKKDKVCTTYGLGADLNIKVNYKQGTVKEAYYISPNDEDEITNSSFSHVNDISNYTYEILATSDTFYHVVPFFVLLVDNNNNLSVNYYQMIAGSTTEIDQNGEKISLKSYQLSPSIYCIENDDLITEKAFTKQIEDNLSNYPEDELNYDDALIDSSKIRRQVSQIKELYENLY